MPSTPDVNIPHFAVPFNLSANGAATVEQDSTEDVAACVGAICRTPKGTRLDSPEFGIDEVVFRERGPDRESLQKTIEFWEPRAQMYIEISRPDVLDTLYSMVEITVGGSF